jgi:tRNA (cytidine/uridine-2'-O-)-methyltransferase
VFEIVLYQPEIPPNTGNVMRLAANTGCTLHLVMPLGFSLEDRHLRRAGLDYREYADVRVHADWAAACARLEGRRIYALSTRGCHRLHDARFLPGDVFLFGPETRGLPAEILEALPAARRLRLPMRPGSRSLNLSNAVAVTIYEAWRQNGFAGAV